MILLENSNEWNLSLAKKGSSRKKREEQGLKSKRGETSFEKLHVSKKKKRGCDEDIIGPCGVRFDPEAHIPPVEYGQISRSTGAAIGVSE
jgi:hypothetical protein